MCNVDCGTLPASQSWETQKHSQWDSTLGGHDQLGHLKALPMLRTYPRDSGGAWWGLNMPNVSRALPLVLACSWS